MSKTEDLVVLSGVSRSTVFRFLRGEGVRPAAKAAILSAMQQLNIPHDDHTVHHGAVLQISVKRDFRSFKGYGLAIAGFMSRAEAQGFQVNLRTGNLSDAEESRNGNGKNAKNPAGVLVLGMTMEEEEYEIRYYRENSIPFVFVNRNFDDPSVSWVSCDLQRAARDAVNHLLDLGHRDIGTWGVTDSSRLDAVKRRGFLDAFEVRGLAVPGCRLDASTHGDLEIAVQNLVDGKRLPEAWFCSCDEHAMRFIKVMRRNGIRIPEDVAIVSMDDADSSEYLSPALTTISMPFQSEGATAFDVLKHLIENPEEESLRVILKHELVVRESCGAGASGGLKRP